MKYIIFNRYNFLKTYLLPLAVVVLLSQGCATNSQNNKRLERYQPIVSHRDYQVPVKSVQVVNQPQVTKPKVELVSAPAPKRSSKVKPEKVVTKQPAVKDNLAVKNGETEPAQRMRKLKHGDMVTVGLYGIPEQIEVKESIDNFGSISLPLIDVIKIVGLGTSAAERKIRDAYINSGFYTDLSVVVMAMADEYFIRGEVKKVGNYPLIGDRTLLQAITAAGGYTDFAKLSKVTILRLEKDPMVFDCHKIAKRRIADPLIHPGDIIIVPRRIFWK